MREARPTAQQRHALFAEMQQLLSRVAKRASELVHQAHTEAERTRERPDEIAHVRAPSTEAGAHSG